MRPDEFKYIAELIKKRSGLALTEDKIYLLENRLQPIARNCGCKNISELIALMRLKAGEEIFEEVTDAMTTNESMFFRDVKPFEQFRQVILPRMWEANAAKKQLRIWSAACSNGQEPYTIAMCLMEDAAKMPGWNYEIVATDLSKRVLDKAGKGIYTQFEVQRGLPIQMLLKYFQRADENHWQIKEALRKMVSFRVQNLLVDLAGLGRFDIIFCRNVLIYFDEPTKAQVLESISKILQPGGVLFLGSTETIIGISDKFKMIDNHRGVFIHAAAEAAPKRGVG